MTTIIQLDDEITIEAGLEYAERHFKLTPMEIVKLHEELKRLSLFRPLNLGAVFDAVNNVRQKRTAWGRQKVGAAAGIDRIRDAAGRYK